MTETFQKKIRLRQGRGFLVRIKNDKGPTYPNFRGALVLPKRYYRGKRVLIHGWVSEFYIQGVKRKILRIEISSREKARKRHMKELKARWAEADKIRAQKDRIAAREAARQEKTRLKMLPKEIKREDVI